MFFGERAGVPWDKPWTGTMVATNVSRGSGLAGSNVVVKVKGSDDVGAGPDTPGDTRGTVFLVIYFLVGVPLGGGTPAGMET